MMKQRWVIPLAAGAALAVIAAAPVLETDMSVEDAANDTAPAVVARPDIEPLVDALFSAEGVGETRVVLVMHEGEIVAERYAPGYTPDMRYISWSMAKTVTAMLVGFLVEDGVLELDAPAPIPEWQGEDDPRGAITLRHLLHMASGLDHTEVNDPIWDSDTNRMLFTSETDDMAAYAVSRPLEADPGEKFEYSSATTIILSRIIADALTDSEDPGARAAAYRRFAEQRLLGPAGISSVFFEFDASGTQIGGSLIHATARDWAQLGEVMRTGQGLDGREIISPEWREFMVTPSPLNGEYGGQTWLNRPGGVYGNPVLFPDRAPNSLFAFNGHLGQYVMVSPEQGLTVVRLGNTPDGDLREAVVVRLARIFEAFG
ncbi:serine hydrolase [Parasphingopyxis sp. CP4]|uniref:serine hydrolase domain-containing protein n=1 Tax=Parasphingopyxis sp. CP4 TaxID=2724527 RepID=UPI0015A0D8A2|nr:serine hydrolase [Parasphingopyxis sp. CP4]QLC22132.1 serine hydrolase [Parasphingopyxis sp. CP4]